MDYEPGVEKYHFDDASNKWDQWWYRFHNDYGFAIGPVMMFMAIVVALIMFGHR